MGKYTPSTGGGGGGGGTVSVAEKYGVQGDYATHYGILDCPNGLITYSLGKDIIIEPGIVLQAAGSDTKTTIASAINYTIVEDTDVTLFYAEGTILEAGAVYYQTEEPTDGDVGYLAWFNPEIMQWQFKSDDTGNVWRTAVATPIANVRIVDGNITRLDYMGYRILDDDIIAHKQDVDELEALLDEKQDLLNTTDPIRIGTTTIGEPNNISTAAGYISPNTTTNFPNIQEYSTTGVDFLQPRNTGTEVSTFNDSFKDMAYFDIPVNFSNYYTDDYSGSEGIVVHIGGMTNFNNSNWAILYIGKLNEEDFEPYAVSKHLYYNQVPYFSILSSKPEIVTANTTDTQTRWRASGNYALAATASTVNETAGVYLDVTIQKRTTGELLYSCIWDNGTKKYVAQYTYAINAWDLEKLRECNVIRVALRTTALSANYHPSVDDTYISYKGVSENVATRLPWNIESGIVKTYGIALKYDNQTLQVNSKGELVANLDELGNEVNAISSRVTTLETNTGGFKFVKLTQAEYDALETKDENTMYVING